MFYENNELSKISCLIDEIIISKSTQNNDNDVQNEQFSKLYEELRVFEDELLTPSMLDKYEESFIKLNRLSSISSSPLFIGCCLMMLEKLLLTEYLLKNMERNKLKCNEYYILAMNALNTKHCLDYLQSNQNLSLDLYRNYVRLYLYMARETIRFRNRTSELLNVQEWNLHSSYFEDKYKIFLKNFLFFIDKNINENEDLSSMIGFLISLSDDIHLVPNLVECELPQHLKHWLLTFINNNEIKDHNLCESILLIINNIARHEDGSNIFKNISMSDILPKFWAMHEKNLSKDSITVYYMAYALIVTPEQLKSAIVLHDVIDYLVQNINIASSSSDMRTDSAHISEYLVALARLIVNDNVAQYIINTCQINGITDGLTFFNTLFKNYNDLTVNDLYLKHLSRIALFNIVCSFSFQTLAQKQLLSDKIFIEIIKKASHYNNEHDIVIQPSLLQYLLSVKQAAEAILINLDLYKDNDTIIQTDVSSLNIKHHHVMISYSHKDIVFCRNLVQALKSKSIHIWVDEDGHCRSDDCWEEIAMAIKYASTILIIVSPHYCQSVSCRKEATYADKRKKTLIAIYPNDDKYEPDEWLDIRLSGSYVRFGGKKKSFDHCISRLIEYIRPNENDIVNPIVLKTTVPSPSQDQLQQFHEVPIEIIPPISTKSVNMTKLSIHDWTKSDVETWFLVERNLLPELYKLYSFIDGDSLLEYAKYFIQEYEYDSKKQYEKLSKRLHNEFNIEFYDNHYTNFVCSMKKLLLTYDSGFVSTVKTTNKKSSSCLIL